MAVYNCPLCELRFSNKNERDWHLRNEHEHLHVHPPAEHALVWSRPRHADADERDDRHDEDRPGRDD
ncbi:MAG TPA: hypothetical protein VI357_13840 [Mycobacteriales bacterium]